MNSLSGLILDVYDDYDGSVLREVYPTFDGIPSIVKEAQSLSAEELRTLPDDVFALVLLNNGESLRKFACVDAGGTRLSVEYFLKNAHKLPVNAQQTGAENLVTACGWYGLEVPEKLAGIAGTALTALTAVPIIKGTASGIKSNMANVRAGESGGMGVVPPGMPKMGEASGTTLMPNQPPASLAVTPAKTVIQKTARLMHPTVDVSGSEPAAVVTEKKASIFAIPSEGKYPLETYEQVKTASDWFGRYNDHLSPAKRREFASNFMKRAEELGIEPANADLRRYGSNDFASEAEIKAAFDARRLEIAHNEEALTLLGAVEKVARTRVWRDADSVVQLGPEQICSLVEEFDKVAGINYHYDTVPDPFYTVYGCSKTAEKDDAAWSDQIANDYVTREDLERLSQIGAFSVKTTFGSDFQEEFLKDPVGMYKSLPRVQKKMLIRMANSTQPGVERTY
jgi:hypothetical protein